VLNFEIPMPVVVEAARRIHDAGARLVLNVSPIYPVPDEVLRFVDLLIVNELEAASVIGAALSPVQMLQRIRARRVPGVVITLGPDGAIFADGVESGCVAGYPVEAVDPTAAGDAFLGTLLAAIVSGSGMADACRRANAAGALAVSRAGAQPSIPTRTEVDAALRRWSGVGA
jgi:ribokinase